MYNIPSNKQKLFSSYSNILSYVTIDYYKSMNNFFRDIFTHTFESSLHRQILLFMIFLLRFLSWNNVLQYMPQKRRKNNERYCSMYSKGRNANFFFFTHRFEWYFSKSVHYTHTFKKVKVLKNEINEFSYTHTHNYTPRQKKFKIKNLRP